MNQNFEQLPIAQHRASIVDCLRKYDTLVLIGETGSGKSTQVPKYAYLDYLQSSSGTLKGQVAVTQPRRVAAISLAKRVSEEMGEAKVGGLVGYSVRFDEAVSKTTRIKYVTDGMLLREALTDPSLSRYSLIILDEAHERTLRTDILFGMLKRLQAERTDLKLVVMSATLDPEKFVAFFRNPFVLNIPGRQFPVKINYTLTPQQDYLDAAVVAIFQLHRDVKRQGDILVFLTGQEEIESVKAILDEYGPLCPPPCPRMIVVPIYAALSSQQQMLVFSKTPAGSRKIVLATNIAETSITIPGIRFVIDPGFVKMRTFEPRTGMETLAVVPTSKASCRQRAGRAGREASGECFRLFTEDAFRQLDADTPAEIHRTNLSNVILAMKGCGVDDIVRFDYLEPPAMDSIYKGLEELLALDALGKDQMLTRVGRLMAECPLTPMLSRTLIHAAESNCLSECLSVIAMLSCDNLFLSSRSSSEDQTSSANDFKKQMSHPTGDHLTLLNVYTSFSQSKDQDRWCRDNQVDPKAFKQIVQIRQQLEGFCQHSGLLMTSPVIPCDPNTRDELVLKAFCRGFHTQIASLQPDKTFKTLTGRQQVFIHPSSVLHTRKPECILYHEVVVTTKSYLRTVSSVKPEWVLACYNDDGNQKEID